MDKQKSKNKKTCCFNPLKLIKPLLYLLCVSMVTTQFKLIEKVKNNINLYKNKIAVMSSDKKEEYENELNKIGSHYIAKKLNQLNSKIIDNPIDIDLINNRMIRTSKGLINKNIKYELLYRATVDGDKISTIKKMCENIKGTFTIIKYIENSELKKIGIYTQSLFSSQEDKDKTAFAIDFNSRKIFNIKENESVMKQDGSFSFSFYPISIPNKFFTLSTDKRIGEIEIYKVIFE